MQLQKQRKLNVKAKPPVRGKSLDHIGWPSKGVTSKVQINHPRCFALLNDVFQAQQCRVTATLLQGWETCPMLKTVWSANNILTRARQEQTQKKQGPRLNHSWRHRWHPCAHLGSLTGRYPPFAPGANHLLHRWEKLPRCWWCNSPLLPHTSGASSGVPGSGCLQRRWCRPSTPDTTKTFLALCHQRPGGTPPSAHCWRLLPNPQLWEQVQHHMSLNFPQPQHHLLQLQYQKSGQIPGGFSSIQDPGQGLSRTRPWCFEASTTPHQSESKWPKRVLLAWKARSPQQVQPCSEGACQSSHPGFLSKAPASGSWCVSKQSQSVAVSPTGSHMESSGWCTLSQGIHHTWWHWWPGQEVCQFHLVAMAREPETEIKNQKEKKRHDQKKKTQQQNTQPRNSSASHPKSASGSPLRQAIGSSLGHRSNSDGPRKRPQQQMYQRQEHRTGVLPMPWRQLKHIGFATACWSRTCSHSHAPPEMVWDDAQEVTLETHRNLYYYTRNLLHII